MTLEPFHERSCRQVATALSISSLEDLQYQRKALDGLQYHIRINLLELLQQWYSQRPWVSITHQYLLKSGGSKNLCGEYQAWNEISEANFQEVYWTTKDTGNGGTNLENEPLIGT